MCIYVYLYVCVHVCLEVHVLIYIYAQRERKRERERENQRFSSFGILAVRAGFRLRKWQLSAASCLPPSGAWLPLPGYRRRSNSRVIPPVCCGNSAWYMKTEIALQLLYSSKSRVEN